MKQTKEKRFSTVSRLKRSQEKSAFFDAQFQTDGKVAADGFSKKGVFEISCKNPSCQFALRTQNEEAEHLLERVSQNGCPICGEKEFALFNVTTL